ncbi:hypothetical protein GGR56DRAFT_633467 [Xylariaceae sp. FL0804]|nr:hypothetical protein GGR56DRAFT_633467 [Xylariaceae sp. FL0804]
MVCVCMIWHWWLPAQRARAESCGSSRVGGFFCSIVHRYSTVCSAGWTMTPGGRGMKNKKIKGRMTKVLRLGKKEKGVRERRGLAYKRRGTAPQSAHHLKASAG